MKKVSHEIEKLGVDRVKIKTLFRDRFKRPALVSIERHRVENPESSVLIDGDPKEVTDLMHGLAEIAWDMGWRPRGLSTVVGMVVQQYKLPPEQL